MEGLFDLSCFNVCLSGCFRRKVEKRDFLLYLVREWKNHTWLTSRNFKLYIIGIALRNVGQMQSFGCGPVLKADSRSVQRNTNADAAHGGFIFRAFV